MEEQVLTILPSLECVHIDDALCPLNLSILGFSSTAGLVAQIVFRIDSVVAIRKRLSRSRDLEGR
jgi:hypothetical protein